MSNDDGKAEVLFGFIACGIMLFIVFTVAEKACESEHNIYDCEMTFVPSKKEPK